MLLVFEIAAAVALVCAYGGALILDTRRDRRERR